MAQAVVIIPAQECRVELSHVVTAVVVLVRVVQPVGGALDAVELPHQVQLEPLLHTAGGAGGAGGGGDGDGGDGGDPTGLTPVSPITHRGLVGTVLVIAAA